MAESRRIRWIIATGLAWFAAAGTIPDAVAADDLTPAELETLVGPVALYPDDLLAIVLPAATHPVQVVLAARYLDRLKDDDGLEPDPDWDESVVALLNYPEVVEKLNEDLDWTAALGQAVLAREEAVLAAINRFRRKAYAAGNLATDRRQRVEVEEDVVRIRRADPAVMFVPYYQPALVHRPQLHKVYHYHPRPCPVYFYPYPAGHYLLSRHFWGLTGAFSIAWDSRDLHFHRHRHRSHPYYGHEYAFRHYRYWRPRLYDDDWRHERYRAIRPIQRPAQRFETPLTRPPAGTGLSRLRRYRDDTGTSAVRQPRLAPRAGTAPSALSRRIRSPAAASPHAEARSSSGSSTRGTRTSRMRIRPH